MDGFKKGFEGLIRDAQSAAEALRQLQGIAKETAGQVNTSLGAMGGVINRSGQAIGIPDMGTDIGNKAKQDFVNSAWVKHQDEFEKAVVAGRVSQLQDIKGRQILHVEGGLNIGKQNVEQFPIDMARRKKQFENLFLQNMGPQAEAHAIIGRIGASPSVSPATSPSLAMPSYTNEYASGIGYSVSDLARVSKGASEFRSGGGDSAVAEAIKRLSQSNEDTAHAMAANLRQLQAGIAENTARLNEASRAYHQVMNDNKATVEQRVQAEKKLTAAIGALDTSLQGTRDVLKHSGGPGGPSGPELDNTKFLKWQKAASIFGAAAGIGTAGATMAMGVGLQLDKAVHGADLRIASASGNIAEREYDMEYESHDMTKARNILRYRADMLFPDRKFQYIGRSGRENALNVAANMARHEREIQRQERTIETTSGAGSMVGGLIKAGLGAAALATGGIAGMTGVGAVPGVMLAAFGGGMLASGVSEVMGGSSSVARAQIGSKVSAEEGKLGEGLLGVGGRLKHGEQWGSMVEALQKATSIEQLDKIMSTRREFEDSELKKMRREEGALQEIISMKSAQQEAVIALGADAMGVGRFLSTASFIPPSGSGGRVSGKVITPAGGGISKEKALALAIDKEESEFNKSIYKKRGYSGTGVINKSQLNDPVDIAKKQTFDEIKQFGIDDKPLWTIADQLKADIKDLDKTVEDQPWNLLAWAERRSKKAELAEELHTNTVAAGMKAKIRRNANELQTGKVDRAKQDLNQSISNQKSQVNSSNAPFDLERYRDLVKAKESRGNYNIQHDTTSAFGAYQFVEATRKPLMKDLGIVGDDWKTPENQDRMFDLFTKQNQQALQRIKSNKDVLAAGRIQEYDDYQLMYGLHGRGEAGLKQILTTGVDPHAGDRHRNVHIFGLMDSVRGGVAKPYKGGSYASGSPASRMVSPAYEGKLAGTDYSLSDLAISPTEFIKYNTQLSSAMGVGAKVGENMADKTVVDMIRLGRSGLGSFEQQTANLTALNRITGQSDNISNLGSILTEAVSQGFDKSRLAQSFTQTNLQVMQSLGLGSAAYTSDLIGGVASVLGGGKANEMTLMEAAKGVSSLASFTGSTTGAMGGAKFLGAISSGASLATGLGAMTDSNLVRNRDWMKILESDKFGENSEMPSELRNFVWAQEGKTFDEKMANAKKTIGGTIESIKGQTFQNISSYGFNEGKFKADMAKAKTDEEKMFVMRTAAGNAAMAAQNMGLDQSAGSAWFYEEYAKDQPLLKGMSQAAKDQLYKERIDKANIKYDDPAQQKLKQYLHKNLSNFVQQTKGVGEEQYKDFLKAGGENVRHFAISGETAKKFGIKEQAITLDLMEKADAKTKAAIKETLGNAFTHDLAMAASEGISGSEIGAQSVKIANWDQGMMQLAIYIASISQNKDLTGGQKQNLNK